MAIQIPRVPQQTQPRRSQRPSKSERGSESDRKSGSIDTAKTREARTAAQSPERKSTELRRDRPLPQSLKHGLGLGDSKRPLAAGAQCRPPMEFQMSPLDAGSDGIKPLVSNDGKLHNVHGDVAHEIVQHYGGQGGPFGPPFITSFSTGKTVFYGNLSGTELVSYLKGQDAASVHSIGLRSDGQLVKLGPGQQLTEGDLRLTVDRNGSITSPGAADSRRQADVAADSDREAVPEGDRDEQPESFSDHRSLGSSSIADGDDTRISDGDTNELQEKALDRPPDDQTPDEVPKTPAEQMVEELRAIKEQLTHGDGHSGIEQQILLVQKTVMSVIETIQRMMTEINEIERQGYANMGDRARRVSQSIHS